MDAERRRALEAQGYVVTTAAEWLGLSQAESDYIRITLDLRRLIRFSRERAGLTQAQAARKLKSSQSRVSKMEAGDPTVSLDLLVSSALTLGATRSEVAAAVAGPVSLQTDEEPASTKARSQPGSELKATRRARSAKAA